MLDLEALERETEALGVRLTEEQLAQFETYARLLVDWNERVNLTAITAPAEIVTKHFADSLSMAAFCPLQEGAAVLDVGTGAGFPGVPLKIWRPDLCLTLLDGSNKRILFLKELCARLGLESLCVHARAEEAGRMPEHRAAYDLVTARAVAHLRELFEYCLPFLKVGGHFVAMKGRDIEGELEEANPALQLLGGYLEQTKSLTLADGSMRTLLLIKKWSQTSSLYPRPHAKMTKNPLN